MKKYLLLFAISFSIQFSSYAQFQGSLYTIQDEQSIGISSEAISQIAGIEVNDESIVEDKLLIGSDFNIDLFGTVKKFRINDTAKYFDHISSIIATSDDGYSLTLSINHLQSRVVGDIKNLQSHEHYHLKYSSSNQLNYLARVSPSLLNELECNADDLELIDQGVTNNNSRALAENTDTYDINVLIPYTENAEQYAISEYGSIEEVISQSLIKSQEALNNSQVFININLAHYYLTTYDDDANENVSANEHLRRLTTSKTFEVREDIFFTEVERLRIEHEADLVAAFLSEPNTGGIAWIMNDINGIPDFGYSVNRIEQIAWTYTLIHEIGHNMGSHHSRIQSLNPAPANGGLFNYSTGWAWEGLDNEGSSVIFASVMTYEEETRTRAPIFSNPEINWGGAPSGSVDQSNIFAPADNARSIRETKSVISQYDNLIKSDLRTFDLIVEGGDYTSSDEIQVSFNIANDGGSYADNFEWEVQLNGFNEGSDEIIELATNSSETINLNLGSQNVGDYVLTITVDPNDEINESNETNNSSSFEFTVDDGPPIDLEVRPNTTFSPIPPVEGEVVTIEAVIYNNSDLEVNDRSVEALLIGPNAEDLLSTSVDINELGPGVQTTVDLSLQLPSNLDDGIYNIVVRVPPDSYSANNAQNLSFRIGPVLDTESYEAPDLELVFEGDEFSINGNSVEVFAIADDEVAFYINGDLETIDEETIETYPAWDMAIAVEFSDNSFSFTGASIYKLTEVNNRINFDNSLVQGYRGEEIYFEASPPAGLEFQNDASVFTDDGTENIYEDWFDGFNSLDNNRKQFRFDIPNDATIGEHRFFFVNEFSGTERVSVSRLIIEVVPQPPSITSLSSSEFSADDRIQINGSNFTTSTGKVKFNELDGLNYSWSDNEIEVTVPEGIEGGTLYVQNSNGISEGFGYQIISNTGDPYLIQRIQDTNMNALDTLIVADLENVFADPNGDELIYTSETDVVLEVINSELDNGRLSLFATSGAEGNYPVVISATDADQATVSDTFYVDVRSIFVAPELVYPENNLTELPLDFDFVWDEVEGATSYDFQVSGNENFSSTITSGNNLTSLTRESRNLDYSESYYWRVRADFNEESSPWSEVFQFSTKDDIVPIAIYFPDSLAGTVGDTLNFPISIDNISNQFFEAFQFNLGYDESLVDIIGFDTTGTIGGRFTIESNLNRMGELLINGATDTPVSSSGTLVELNVELVDTGKTELKWNSFYFNEGVPETNTLNGFITINPKPNSCGDVTNNGSITNEDATLILRHVVALDEIVGEDSVRADVTANGWISSYDASQVLRAVVGKEHIFNCGTLTKSVYKPISAFADWDIQENSSSIIEVPINIESTDEFEAVDLHLSIPKGIRFKGFSRTPENWLITSNVVDQSVNVSMIGLEKPVSDQIGVLTFEKMEEHIQGSIDSRIRVNDNSFQQLSSLPLTEKPMAYSLSQNYPNPFNPSTNISYTIPEQSEVQLVIFNMLGQKVAELVNRTQDAGNYSVVWEAGDVSSGMYVYQLIAGEQIITKSMMLIK